MRRFAVSLCAAALMAASLVSSPAQAVAPRTVALGDSYSAGTGTVSPTTVLDLACLRSSQAHPLALGTSVVDLQACAGASTAMMGSQVAYLAASASDATAVTLTIGGNDIAWTTVVGSCVNSPGCRTSPVLKAAIKSGLAGLSGRVADLLSAIKVAAPTAKIYLAGYPRLFGAQVKQCRLDWAAPGSVDAGPMKITKRDAVWLNQQTQRLNKALRAGVKVARAKGVNAVYVNVDPRFGGHRLCDKKASYVNGIALAAVTPAVVPMPQSLHLNPMGEKAYQRAYQLKGLRVATP